MCIRDSPYLSTASEGDSAPTWEFITWHTPGDAGFESSPVPILPVRLFEGGRRCQVCGNGVLRGIILSATGEGLCTVCAFLDPIRVGLCNDDGLEKLVHAKKDKEREEAHKEGRELEALTAQQLTAEAQALKGIAVLSTLVELCTRRAREELSLIHI